MADLNFTLKFNLVMIQDKEDGGYTAFFAEFPDVIAEGDSKEEVEKNLLQTMLAVSKHKMQNIQSKLKADNVTTKPMNFELELA